jgi:hypothetical protein
MTLQRTLSKLWLALLLIGGVATGMAATITPGSPDVIFSVNEGNDYLTSTPIPPSTTASPGLYASSDIAGSVFELTAQGPDYRDAGIVLYFNGGVQLGSLRSVSVVESSGPPLAINLWFDTGHDGEFFSVNSNGVLTGLNGDSYASSTGNLLTSATSFYMQGGLGAGGTFTLAQLQSGAVHGIDGNTRAALWIGITNPNSAGTAVADISSVTVTTPEPVSMIFVGSGLVGLAIAGRRRKK